ncbi:MAG: hypothetical protein JXR51_16140 [Bacteroidales bacterium]|nr:hypothetical protein [Bacteroidales bacterium]
MTNLKLSLTFLFTLIFLISINIKTFSQMGLAVSKNENGSSVKYGLAVGADIKEAQTNAKKILEQEEASNIFILRSDENTGHELSSGNFVLILSSRKMLGKFFVSYGLGASEKSKEEALKKAIIHMKEWDFGYDDSNGYSIVKEGKIEDLFPEEDAINK